MRGLAVVLTDGDDEQEVGRVAFVREQSTNPDERFVDRLDAVLKRADDAAVVVNDLAYELEGMRRDAEAELAEREREAVEAAKAKVREAVESAQGEKVMS